MPMVLARKRLGASTRFYNVAANEPTRPARLAEDRFGKIVFALGRDREEAGRLVRENWYRRPRISLLNGLIDEGDLPSRRYPVTV